jgi:hypothetical protein
MFITLFFVCQAKAQVERDTTLNRCPVFITDTVSTNNFFIEARPAILKVYRVKGKLTVAVDQKGQLLSFYFHDRRLKTGKYDISPGSRGGREVEALSSFKSGEQVSYISLNSGTIDVTYDKTTKFWFLKVNGMIANLVERSVTYYKVKADLYIK